MKYAMIVILVFLMVPAAHSQDDPSWVYTLQGSAIVVFGADRDSIDLSYAGPGALHPTPGGKYVFVTYDETEMISVVDAESRLEERTFSLGFVADHIEFSQMGETAYISDRTSDEIRIYGHSAGDFTYQRSVSFGNAGSPFALNRRGTRIYRPGGQGVLFLYVKTGEIIDEIETRRSVVDLTLTPDFREIWTILADGSMVVIDEPRGRTRKRLSIEVAPTEVYFDNSHGYVLSSSGDEIIAVSRRNLRHETRLGLARTSSTFVVDQNQGLWSLSTAGLYAADVSNGKQIAFFDLDDALYDLALVILRAGEGFACF
jgi:DNA-binding beta-propeller fold protein YncE